MLRDEIGKKIAAIRKNKKWSQDDLALHSGDVTLQDPFSDEVDFPSNREDIEAELRDALAYAIEHDKEHHNEYFTED